MTHTRSVRKRRDPHACAGSGEPLTPKKVAAMTGLSYYTVLRWIKNGLLIAPRQGNGYRVSHTYVHHLLNRLPPPPSGG